MNDLASASDSPLIQGRNARLYGKTRESCPYEDGSADAKVWLDAFEGRESLTTAPDPEANAPSPPATKVPN